MASLRKRGKVWYYRFVDENGHRCEVRGCADKRETLNLATAAEARAAKLREGFIDHQSEKVAAAGRRAIREHLAEWRQALLDRGNTGTYARLQFKRVTKLVKFRTARRDRVRNHRRGESSGHALTLDYLRN